MQKKKTLIITTILIFIIGIALFVLTGTNALFASKQISSRKNDYNTGLLSIEASSKSDTISLENALPITDIEGKKLAPYIFTIKNNGNIDYQFDIQLLSVNENTFSPEYIKLIIDDGEVTTLGNLTESKIKTNVILKAGESIDVSIRIWLDENTPNSEITKTFASKLVINGIAIHTRTNKTLGASTYISNIYYSSTLSKITINNKEYNYNESTSMINDRLGGITTNLNAGNIRFVGESPNNYLYFNCSDYASPDKNTCEIWRIIGTYNNMLKIINPNKIGNLAWDNNNNINWSTSSLNTYLNNEYYLNNLNNDTNSLIAEITWENNTIGKIGLLSLEDIRYASIEETVSNNNWLTNNINNTWLIDSKDDLVYYANNTNNDLNNANTLNEIRPVLYLNSEVSIYSGNGSLESPYMIR